MKAVKLFQISGLILVFATATAIFAQTENPKTREKENETKTEAVTTTNQAETKPADAAKTESVPQPTPVVADDKTKPVDGSTSSNSTTTPAAEEQQIISYYENYLKEYRLGPNDVITVEVFGQCPDYCITGKTVPPTARISYPLIREGVLVGGKTVEQVAEEITKKLDEYIIDPKVTVTLERAMSARYSVMGKVNAPGIRVLDRKVSIYEAVIEAGGIAKNGDKKKVALVRFDQQGKLTRQLVDLAAMESGKAPMIYLNPGDQVFVPGKGLTLEGILEKVGQFSALRVLFGSPF